MFKLNLPLLPEKKAPVGKKIRSDLKLKGFLRLPVPKLDWR